MDHKCAGCGRSFRTTQGLGLHWDHARKGHGGCTAMQQTETEANDLSHVVEAYRADLARVTAERDAALARLADYEDDHRAVVAGQCAPDERHCSCVPHLRREMEAMRAVEKATRHLVLMLDQTLGPCDLGGSRVATEEAIAALDALRARKVGG